MIGEESQESKDLAELQPRLEEIRPFTSIIPDEIERELKVAVKNKDAGAIKSILDVKIKPLIDKYIAKISNPNFPCEGEQILWMHTVTKGVINKEIMASWVITDSRAAVSTPKGKYYLGKGANFPSTAQIVGLAMCDTVVMNQHRSSRGNRVGTFTGSGGGGFVGTSVSFSSSQSLTYGDLVFLVNGKERFRFQGISDPQGVRRMIETIKKQTKV
jgi:hypothetical protein